VKFCNINFNQRNISDVFERTDKNKTKFIVTVNAQFIVEANTQKRFFEILNNNYTVFDGEVPLITAQIFHYFKKRKYLNQFDFEKVPGSSMVYDFCDFAVKNNYKVFFLGGKAESNCAAVKNIKEKYGIAIDGYSPDFENYPFSDGFNNLCLEKIADFKPDILFVGFGAPKQEYWIDDHFDFLAKVGVKYVVGSGGTFDFVSQRIKRAPIFIQKIGFEGVFRLLQEPSKMRFKRLTDSFKFFKYIYCKPRFTQL